MKGRVRRVNPNKRYGFVRAESGEEYFFHYNDSLTPMDESAIGMEVNFVIARVNHRGEQRLRAIEVQEAGRRYSHAA